MAKQGPRTECGAGTAMGSRIPVKDSARLVDRSVGRLNACGAVGRSIRPRTRQAGDPAAWLGECVPLQARGAASAREAGGVPNAQWGQKHCATVGPTPGKESGFCPACELAGLQAPFGLADEPGSVASRSGGIADSERSRRLEGWCDLPQACQWQGGAVGHRRWHGQQTSATLCRGDCRARGKSAPCSGDGAQVNLPGPAH